MNVNHDNILNKIKSFKIFHVDVESKLWLMEDTIIAGKEAKEITNASSGFIVYVLKDRISSLETELKSKDAIIEYLTKQLLSSNSKKSQMKNDKCNLNETFNGDKSFYGNESSEESNMDKDKTIEQKKKVVITGDPMLNGIHEKGMSKNYRVKVNNFPGGTSATILENIDQLVKSKPDCLIIHAGTDDLANGTNLLNQAKIIVKKVKKVSQNTEIVFSSIIIRKARKYRQKGFTGKLIFKKLLQSKKYRFH